MSGWNLQMGLGPKKYPLTLGLEVGAMLVSRRSYAGPDDTVLISDGHIDFGSTTIRNSTELRHADLILRFEPDWRWFRPFLEVTAGTLQAWTTTSLSFDVTGGARGFEYPGQLAGTYSAGAGVTVAPFPLILVANQDGTHGSATLALTAGIRWLGGTPITYADPTAAGTDLAPSKQGVRMVVPYLLLCLSFRSADRPRGP